MWNALPLSGDHFQEKGCVKGRRVLETATVTHRNRIEPSQCVDGREDVKKVVHRNLKQVGRESTRRNKSKRKEATITSLKTIWRSYKFEKVGELTWEDSST